MQAQELLGATVRELQRMDQFRAEDETGYIKLRYINRPSYCMCLLGDDMEEGVSVLRVSEDIINFSYHT